MNNKILIVDDEEHNRALLKRILRKADFDFNVAKSGEEALGTLKKDANYAAILLDRMMPPGINGLEVFKVIKKSERLKDIPVIFQTAMAQPEEVAEGMKAGAFYYITKPYPPNVQLLAIIQAAIDEYATRIKISEQAKKTSNGLSLISQMEVFAKTLNQVPEVVAILSGAFPDPDKVAIGIYELVLNALEHGNGGISYNQKSELLATGNWEKEVERQLALPENSHKKVLITLTRLNNAIQLIVKDDGAGFNWDKYLDFDHDRITDSHGRGIAMANMMSFDSIEYQGCGNKVVATVNL